jgi:hypothetical protein
MFIALQRYKRRTKNNGYQLIISNGDGNYCQLVSILFIVGKHINYLCQMILKINALKHYLTHRYRKLNIKCKYLKNKIISHKRHKK